MRTARLLLFVLAATCGPGRAAGGPAPTIRSGFPKTANVASGTNYTVTSPSFSANAGDQLVAFAQGNRQPTVTGTTLRWMLRATTRNNGLRHQITTLWTAVVPPGGVTGETASFRVTPTEDWGDATPSGPAQLQVFAFDDSAGLGDVRWRSANGSAGDQPAGMTLRARGADSLLLVGGRASGFTGAGSGATVAGPITNGMGVLSRLSTGAGTFAVSSNASTTYFAFAGIEVLPAGATPPTRDFLALGDSSVESVNSERPWPITMAESLGPSWALYGGGVNWAFSDQVKARWDAIYSHKSWSFVMWKVGANDVTYHGSLDSTSWLALATSIAAAQGANGQVAQAIGGPTWFADDPGWEAYEQADLWARANAPPATHFFDYPGTLGTTIDAVIATCISGPGSDGVHFDDACNDVMAAEAVTEVDALAGVEACVAGQPCSDGDACTAGDTCVAGLCQGAPYTCGTPGACETAEGAACDGAGGCSYPWAPAGAACGDPSTTACTAPDSCDGSGTCRPNHAPSGTPCRAAAGPCDVAETCAGTGAACPTDTFAAPTTVCRAAANDCDRVESCDGSSATCPPDSSVAAGTACEDASACVAGGTCRGSVCFGGAPELALAPRNPTWAGTGREVEITVTHSGSRGPITLTGATIDPAGAFTLAVEPTWPAAVAAGQSVRLTVRFIATVPGDHEATLRVHAASCADEPAALRGTVPPAEESSRATPGPGGGCSCGADGAGWAGLALLGVLSWRRGRSTMRVAHLLLLVSAAAACGGGTASGSSGGGGGGGGGGAGPTIRSGFPVVANHATAAPPFTITTAGFSANAGDTLVAIASAHTLPILQGTSLRWVQRALTRSNTQRERQTALYTAVVPPGGVSGETVSFSVPTSQEWGDTVPSTPAQLQVLAFDGASGVGSVRWRGNQGATAATAGLTLKANAAGSLLIVGGASWDQASWGAGAGTALVGSVTNRMGVMSRVASAAGSVAVMSNATTTSWEMVGIEVLPAGVAPPDKKLLTLGDSGTESNDSDNPWPPLVQEALGAGWALYGGGVWWAYSDQTRARWAAMWSKESWDAVTLHVGSNDALYHGGLDTTSWTALASSIAATGTRLIVQTIESTSYYGTPRPGQAVIDAADAAQRANAPAGSTFFDWDAALGSTISQASVYLSPDGIHWNDAGNARIAAEFVTELASMGATSRR